MEALDGPRQVLVGRQDKGRVPKAEHESWQDFWTSGQDGCHRREEESRPRRRLDVDIEHNVGVLGLNMRRAPVVIKVELHFCLTEIR